MQQSRRKFLKGTGLATGGLLISPAIFEYLLKSKSTSANHLLFDPGDIPAIKRRLELPIFKELKAELFSADLAEDRQFLETGIQFNNQLRHLPKICKIIRTQSFVYALTGERERGEFARFALQQLFKFKKWDYFLEAGKHVIGIQRASLASQTTVLAADWLADLLSAEEQETLVQQLIEKGCKPCYRSLHGMLHPDKVVGWSFDPATSFKRTAIDFRRWPTILSRTNLRAVPMSALGISSIFLKGKDSRAEKWLELVQQNYQAFYDLFGADGSYPEGTGYCNYTCFELSLFFEILRRKTGQDWTDKINWQGVMDFFLMTHIPTELHPKGQVNFGDGGQSFNSALGFWVAKTFRDGKAQFAATHCARFHTLFSPIMYRPEIPETQPQDNWFFRHFDIGWLVATTGFKPEDFVVAMRSGGPANHEHADRNSVILKAFGENLLVDQWHPTYDRKKPGWKLRLSPAHNTVLVDEQGHQYHDGSEGTNSSLAEAKVLAAARHAGYATATSDATQAYVLVNQNVKSILRTLLIVPEFRFLLVVDAFESRKEPAEFSARWFVENTDEKAKILIDGESFQLQRPGGKLVGQVAANLALNLSVEKIEFPEAENHYPFVAIRSTQKSEKVKLLHSFVALPANAPEMPEIAYRQNGSVWEISVQQLSQKLEIVADLNTKIPGFDVKFG